MMLVVDLAWAPLPQRNVQPKLANPFFMQGNNSSSATMVDATKVETKCQHVLRYGYVTLFGLNVSDCRGPQLKSSSHFYNLLKRTHPYIPGSLLRSTLRYVDSMAQRFFSFLFRVSSNRVKRADARMQCCRIGLSVQFVLKTENGIPKRGDWSSG